MRHNAKREAAKQKAYDELYDRLGTEEGEIHLYCPAGQRD